MAPLDWRIVTLEGILPGFRWLTPGLVFTAIYNGLLRFGGGGRPAK